MSMTVLIAGTTALGTGPAQLIDALRAKEIVGTRRTATVEDLAVLRRPAILFVDYPGLGPDSHAIVFLPKGAGHLALVDPLRGLYDESAEALAARWRGRLVKCAPAPSAR
jgi:hypothetical protein